MSAMYDQAFLGRLEQGLRAALPRWGIDADAPLRLLTVSENATFRVSDLAGGRELVFRVHRPRYHTKAEIASELAWIEALRAGAVVVTPKPIPQRDGALIADLADGGEIRHVVAFEFLPGAEPPERDLIPWFGHLGAVHARLHVQARAWARPASFVRKSWTIETTIGATPHWGDWRAGLGLDAQGRAVLDRTSAVLARHLGGYGQGRDRFGLAHADLRLANLLVDGDRLAVIDFDDCGFAWYLYDFASAVSFIEHEPIVPALQEAWIEGYRKVAPLAAEDIAVLPDLIMLRRILLTAWIASHSETPTALALGTGYTAGTVALAEGFLAAHG